MSTNCRIVFTLNALSSVGEFVAFVSQYPESTRVNLILYCELLYTYKEIMSEYVFYVYLIDMMVTLTISWIGLNSKYIIVVYFDQHYIDEFYLLKTYLHILMMVSIVLGYE